jgi:hypothetical protein
MPYGGILVPTRFLIAALAGTMLTASAEAATFYTDAGAFNAATSGLTTGNFDGLVPVGQSGFYANGVTVNGVTFRGPLSFVLSEGPNSLIYPNQSFYSGQDQVGTAPVPKLITTISFPEVGAFGMVYGGYFSRGEAVSFTLSDGSLFDAIIPGSFAGTAFFGFTSQQPITSINVRTRDTGLATFDVLSFSFGQAAVPAVPEPASWAMLITGFGVAGVAMRRRRRIATA